MPSRNEAIIASYFLENHNFRGLIGSCFSWFWCQHGHAVLSSLVLTKIPHASRAFTRPAANRRPLRKKKQARNYSHQSLILLIRSDPPTHATTFLPPICPLFFPRRPLQFFSSPGPFRLVHYIFGNRRETHHQPCLLEGSKR
jgi:hypothetical protein